ncbi:DUF4339 domain-containing protein [Roseimicrobium sp. ORNL1]|uniref:DUF4339 domain-containing protein n=1 Tax=Roseimicrobium sp. ORNL1 TaxID=2711231 RepID=UPI0013E0FA9C|nr:DUF4339 domain-containing protein [Roseimicrobium sp. ORNL1]QIF03547.1 DUF4339 domain-containing protein [Roseimicrobium sp. ORNL1]
MGYARSMEKGATTAGLNRFFLAAHNRLCFSKSTMHWYYEQEGKPVGPVTEEAFQAARASGLVSPATRVWREGWPDWRPAGDLAPTYTGTQPPPVPASLMHAASRCAECNQVLPDLVHLGGVSVCESCKPHALAKLREGIVLGAGPWRDGQLLVTLKNTPLPEACLKCGAPPVKQVKKALSWHHPALYLIIFVGLLIYLILALCLRKTATIFVPLCAECNGRRKRNGLISFLGFAGALVAFIVAGATLEGDASTAAVLAGVGLLLFSLIWMASTQLVLAKKINETHAWVKKAGSPFLDRLPQWTGPE